MQAGSGLHFSYKEGMFLRFLTAKFRDCGRACKAARPGLAVWRKIILASLRYFSPPGLATPLPPIAAPYACKNRENISPRGCQFPQLNINNQKQRAMQTTRLNAATPAAIQPSVRRKPLRGDNDGTGGMPVHIGYYLAPLAGISKRPDRAQLLKAFINKTEV